MGFFVKFFQLTTFTFWFMAIFLVFWKTLLKFGNSYEVRRSGVLPIWIARVEGVADYPKHWRMLRMGGRGRYEIMRGALKAFVIPLLAIQNWQLHTPPWATLTSLAQALLTSAAPYLTLTKIKQYYTTWKFYFVVKLFYFKL